MNRRFAFRTLARLGGLLALGAGLSACSPDAAQFDSVDITGADYAQNLQLPDVNGEVRRLQDFVGQVVVLFFGYTQCPDVCPTTLSEMTALKKALGTDGERLQVLFVSLDPERDTAVMLKSYLAHFDPSFIALRPSLAQLPELAQHFKVYYKKVEGKTPNSYTLDHTAGSYIFDPRGRIRLFARYGSPPAALAHDIRVLLKTS